MSKRVIYTVFTILLSMLYAQEIDPDFQRHRTAIKEFTLNDIQPYLLEHDRNMSDRGFRGVIYNIIYRDDATYYYTIKNQIFDQMELYNYEIDNLLAWKYKPDMVVNYQNWDNTPNTTLFYQDGIVISFSVIAYRTEPWDSQDDLIDY